MRRTVIAVVIALAALTGLVVAAPAADAHQMGTDGCSSPLGSHPDWGANWNFHDECDWHDLAYVYHWFGHNEDARKATDDYWRWLMLSDCDNRWRSLPWWNQWPKWDCKNVAQSYYSAVRYAGWKPWWDAYNWGRQVGLHR